MAATKKAPVEDAASADLTDGLDDDVPTDPEVDDEPDVLEKEPTPVEDVDPNGPPPPITPSSTPSADLARTNYERTINNDAVAFGQLAKYTYEVNVSAGRAVTLVVHDDGATMGNGNVVDAAAEVDE